MALGLRVEAILLNRTNLGCTVSVCVTVMCRRRLLDSRFGQVLVPRLTCIPVSSVCVLPLVLRWSCFNIPCGVTIRPLSIDRRGNRPHRRKINFMCPCNLTCRGLRVRARILAALIWTALCRGRNSLAT